MENKDTFEPFIKKKTSRGEGEEGFLPSKELADVKKQPIYLKNYPMECDFVFIQGKSGTMPVKLLKELANGGEGYIYETDYEGLIAKIFKKEKLDAQKEEKIKLMAQKRLNCPGVCFPKIVLYNQENTFVGYLMERAHGTELARSLFLPSIFKKMFPNWMKKDTVKLCVTILKKIKYLHDKNVILGDINPANILIVSPEEVYFVDTDSYQVEGFPCPVGMHNFVAPEIQNKNFREFLRTKGHENFSIATLLFMIMLPGQKPYAKKGGSGNLLENIRKMDFPYEVVGKAGENIPSGPWEEIWIHLQLKIRMAFYHTFHESGVHNCEKTRYSVEQWLEKFQSYSFELEVGKLKSIDPLAGHIFPKKQETPCLKKDIQNKSGTGIEQLGVRTLPKSPILMYGLMDITSDAEKVITCAHLLKQEFGQSTATKLLKGNKSALDQLRECKDMDSEAFFVVFGGLKHLSSTEITHLCDYLAFKDYLRQNSGRHKKLEVLAKGKPYLIKLAIDAS